MKTEEDNGQIAFEALVSSGIERYHRVFKHAMIVSHLPRMVADPDLVGNVIDLALTLVERCAAEDRRSIKEIDLSMTVTALAGSTDGRAIAFLTALSIDDRPGLRWPSALARHVLSK